jgi:hypothetical protein
VIPKTAIVYFCALCAAWLAVPVLICALVWHADKAVRHTDKQVVANGTDLNRTIVVVGGAATDLQKNAEA